MWHGGAEAGPALWRSRAFGCYSVAAMVRLLLIEDEESEHEDLKNALSRRYSVCSAYTGEQGIQEAMRSEPDVILLDIGLPDMNGIELLGRIEHGRMPVIMLTAYAETTLVVQAMRAGAFDYLVKPWDLDVLEEAIERAAAAGAFRRMRGERQGLPELASLVGESTAIRRVKELIVKYARSDAPVLVLGESGTGKELVAEALHRLSARAGGPFVTVNCGAIPEGLLESELYGSEPGAFTDARERAGSFERAAGGTVLLDEIGEMSPVSQVKLLHAVERRRISRVGGTRELPLDVRVLAATNRDLRGDVEQRRFRGDLFYRIAVLMVELPPLRERREDIPLLAAHFLTALGGKGKQVGIRPPALERLLGHAWPGNVRELRNVMERALVLAEGREIGAEEVLFP